MYAQILGSGRGFEDNSGAGTTLYSGRPQGVEEGTRRRRPGSTKPPSILRYNPLYNPFKELRLNTQRSGMEVESSASSPGISYAIQEFHRQQGEEVTS